MAITIALVGNPNSGKTTMFNDLTGSSQHVGNWPGVTVEKKEGHLKGFKKEVLVMDLPGIYSLSPYTLEEVITRNYLLHDKPDVIINVVDASNLERNLYLTTQILEIGIPTVIALNMMDVAEKNGNQIHLEKLSKSLGCPVIPTAAVKGKGLKELIDKTIQIAKKGQQKESYPYFQNHVENALKTIENIIKNKEERTQLRWYTVKLFERDEKIIKQFNVSPMENTQIEEAIIQCEEQLDDDAESIIANERYQLIANLMQTCYKKNAEKQSISDKIDQVFTNKWLALPIFFGIMWLIYYISISTIGDWTIGYVETFFGWIQGGTEGILVSLGASDWALSLVIDGIIGSIGAIFIYVPQLMILFLFLSLLEDSGYMARVAFIMDRIFRKFGLSGKSFIPMLIGTGCSVPGIMASRTIENDNDRKMTIMLTPFIPCGAKLPVFAMFIALVFAEQAWIGPLIYIIAIATVIISGLILKRMKMFAGDPAPFVIELPNYKLPRFHGVLIHMWEKAKSFIKKAGTIIFAACALLWFLQSFNLSFQYIGTEHIDSSILANLGEVLRPLFAPLGFGDSWAPVVASITGLLAKEVVVATFASLGSSIDISFTMISAFAFMIFTIFAAPCFAAIGAMKREFGSWKWTLFAVGYQTGLAYVLALLVNVFGNLLFKGTAATVPQVLDWSLMEEASENAVVHGDIVLIVFGILLVLGLGITIFNHIRGSQKYASHVSKFNG